MVSINRFFLLLLLIIMVRPVQAFNYQRCSNYLSHARMFKGLTAVSHFSSSTGACSALASNEEMKKRFYIVNYDKLMEDFAKGKGEYSYAFLKFTQCNEEQRKEILREVKKNFSKLIEVPEEHSFMQVNNSIQKVCNTEEG